MSGFIKTEIGLVPSDWQTPSIGDEFFIQQGKQVSVKNRIGNNQKPFLRTANVFWEGIDLSILDKMNFSTEEEKKFQLKQDDLLTCEGGDVGRTAICETDLPGIYYQNHLHRLRPTNDEIIPRYFMYWMNYCIRYTQYYGGAGNKTTIPNLSKSKLAALLFPKPGKDEQKNIVKILSAIQSSILQQEKIINTVQQLKKNLLHKLFTEGINNEPQKETEIGLIPESWEVVKIGSLGTCVTGTTPKTSVAEYYDSPEFDFIAPADIGDTKFVYDSIKKISAAGISVIRGLPANSILCVCIGSTIGKVGLTFKEKSATNQQVNSIICNDDYNPQFVYYLLNYYSKYWKTFSTPSPVPILSKGTFEKIDIPVTKNSEEQKEIVRILSALDAKFEFQSKKKQTLEALFKSMLHQLMTGEIRVTNLELSKVTQYKVENETVTLAAEP